MIKAQRILFPSLAFAIFSAVLIIYLWNRTYPQITSCFDNTADFHAFILSDPLNEQSNSDFLKSSRITTSNVQQLAKLFSFGTLDGRVTALAVSPDNTVVASVSINGPINILHLTTDEVVTISEKKGIIDSLAISASNNILASYNSSGDIVLWDTTNGNQITLWSVGGYSNYNRLLFISPQELIYSTGKSVYLCNLVSKENRKLFDDFGVASTGIFDKGGIASFSEIILTGDRLNLIYSTSGDNDSTGIPEIGIWNFASERKSHSFTLHNAEITDIALSSDGQRLASISRDGIINIVDLSSNNVLSSIQNNGSPSNYTLALNWDGSLVFVADQVTGNLSVWDVDAVSLVSIDSFQAHNAFDVIFNTTGNLIISGGAGQMVDVWGILSE